MKNPNAPGKGVTKTVDPLRRKKDIKSISKILEDNPRDHLLFVMGINNGLRVGDLLKLKCKDVMNLKAGDSIQITESKTQKKNTLMINNVVYRSMQKYFDVIDPDKESFLFYSRKGRSSLSVPSVNRLIKTWVSCINLDGRYGAHSLRKTWGYIQRMEHGTSFEIICKRYQHSSPAITMRYLGIQDREVDEILMHEIG